MWKSKRRNVFPLFHGNTWNSIIMVKEGMHLIVWNSCISLRGQKNHGETPKGGQKTIEYWCYI